MNHIFFSAKDAILEGKLQFLEVPVLPAIHFWHNTEDKIRWKSDEIEAGTYLVKLHYSFAPEAEGGSNFIKIGTAELSFKPKPTDSWLDYQTFSVGKIIVDEDYTGEIILSAIEIPKTDNGAMPDIAWVSLEISE